MDLGNAILELNKNLVAFKQWAIKHHIYVATVILVMESCSDRNGPRAKERRGEILEFFKMQRHQPIVDSITKNDAPQHQQIHHQPPEKLKKHCAAETVLTVHTLILLAGGKNFTDAMSQQPLIDFDIKGFDNTDFDPKFNTSLVF
ncbi:hypothetical protein NA56DRAFT_659613 [Hyaloscypha hepaticicola]|uniref:Uncharacterized protein n=1 Tax=Hyaloscypha hepaticicola TaxID=2082293 RepID=A0A2J6Q2U8_9HELO|nr:hypothetical protein NA56DRAFT_659613 [Hyaloscypha hepaticicola]